MPASSPALSSIICSLNPRRSHQRLYIRTSMDAQSCASVPPAPACTSRKQSLPSASPDSRLSSCRFSAIGTRAAMAASASDTTSVSPSISPSSISSTASFSSVCRLVIMSTWRCSLFFSRMAFCAAAWSFQKSPSALSASSSTSRADAASKSTWARRRSSADEMVSIWACVSACMINRFRKRARHT
ncbi:MAG: Uncharacterised protein [SAR116 cluster bacterium]|nr:MAG: Uncharacterised protein [SAR116 cluster bacterium]